MAVFLRIFFLFFLFFPSLLTAEEDIQYDIKTMSWRKINRNLSSKTSITQTEAFALVRYHEEVKNPDKEFRFRLLYGIASGRYPERIGGPEVETLLSEKFSFGKVIFRISYWKLYLELTRRKLLTVKQKLRYLEKAPLENDPVFLRSWEEQLSVLASNGYYDTVIEKMKNVEKEKPFLFTGHAKYILAHSLWKDGKTSKALAGYYRLLSSDADPEWKRMAVKDLKRAVQEDFYMKLELPELAYVIPYLSGKEKKNLKGRGSINSSLNDKSAAMNIALFYAGYMPGQILPFLSKNPELAKDDSFVGRLADELISGKYYDAAEELIGKYSSSSDPGIQKQKARLYKKKGSKEKFFNATVSYLTVFPYDLTYQDHLIDFLVSTGSNSIHYAKENYWETAFTKIPNVPVKGRLVYWYLRYLKFRQSKAKFNEVLEKAYEHCPGSYYNVVINEEFHQEISLLTVPSSPFASKESLLKYFSLKKYDEYSTVLTGHNLSFAYFKDSPELANRLKAAKEKVKNSQYLQTAAEYLRYGNMKEALEMADSYSRDQNLSLNQKYEIYVGLGDSGRNAYMSLFFTRQLMKNYMIPDDPLLLPEEISSRLYPRPHRDLVVKNAAEYNVEEEVVYAIMRQESFFRENAVSPSNARGLMQVMPATGKFLAGKLGVKDYSLHDPEFSIRFGAKFLGDLLKNYEGKLTWAAIAYNGGPGNLRKWRRNHYKNDFNHFLEELPSKESRDYCRIIISNYRNYKVLSNLQRYYPL